MNAEQARASVRNCLRAVRPDLDIERVSDDAPLLEWRIITSFQVVDLLLHLENAAGARIERARLVPECFRDIATIARVFLQGRAGT